jgi:acetyl-CoA carboxylase biotin carboxyl carrier protein
MRKEEIEELIRLVEESQIAELEVSEGRKRIRIAKACPGPAVVANSASAPAEHAASERPAVSSPERPVAPVPTPRPVELAPNLKEIKSPMVGTFYRAPAPGAEAFVEEGQAVAIGETVCIVEAMKLMNEIASDYNGVVQKALIDNAQPVEYGQPLFLVEIK